MLPKKEIEALFHLIDDPDTEVYNTVADQLLHYGKEIIPSLEHLWEITEDEDVQERIAHLIHRVHFQDVQTELMQWASVKEPELLRGAILVAKYQYPELNVPFLLTQFEQIRKNLWLELNNYLTPVEKINTFNGILYNYYKLQGHELTENDPDRFFVNKLLESKQGNVFSIGVLYIALAELLDIPVFATAVPRQFLMAYVDTLRHFYSADDSAVRQNSFYIDPMNGMVFTQMDVEFYLRKLGVDPKEDVHYRSLDNKQILHRMMDELCTCYQMNNKPEKAEEIAQLMALLNIEEEE